MIGDVEATPAYSKSEKITALPNPWRFEMNLCFFAFSPCLSLLLGIVGAGEASSRRLFDESLTLQMVYTLNPTCFRGDTALSSFAAALQTAFGQHCRPDGVREYLYGDSHSAFDLDACVQHVQTAVAPSWQRLMHGIRAVCPEYAQMLGEESSYCHLATSIVLDRSLPSHTNIVPKMRNDYVDVNLQIFKEGMRHSLLRREVQHIIVANDMKEQKDDYGDNWQGDPGRCLRAWRLFRYFYAFIHFRHRIFTLFAAWDDLRERVLDMRDDAIWLTSKGWRLPMWYMRAASLVMHEHAVISVSEGNSPNDPRRSIVNAHTLSKWLARLRYQSAPFPMPDEIKCRDSFLQAARILKPFLIAKEWRAHADQWLAGSSNAAAPSSLQLPPLPTSDATMTNICLAVHVYYASLVVTWLELSLYAECSIQHGGGATVCSNGPSTAPTHLQVLPMAKNMASRLSMAFALRDGPLVIPSGRVYYRKCRTSRQYIETIDFVRVPMLPPLINFVQMWCSSEPKYVWVYVPDTETENGLRVRFRRALGSLSRGPVDMTIFITRIFAIN